MRVTTTQIQSYVCSSVRGMTTGRNDILKNTVYSDLKRTDVV